MVAATSLSSSLYIILKTNILLLCYITLFVLKTSIIFLDLYENKKKNEKRIKSSIVYEVDYLVQVILL